MSRIGERIIPKLMNPRDGILIEHMCRYVFAKQFCMGKVLDIACGVGYGSELLLDSNSNIKQYVGIDIDPKSIEYAIENYSCFQTSYYVDDALNENLYRVYGEFDTIISFETIEHFEGDKKFIQNLYNLLKPGGTLIISTPFGKGKEFPCACPYHVYQYTEDEFHEVLKCFREVIMYHQIDNIIELPKPDLKYYLMVAVCKK